MSIYVILDIKVHDAERYLESQKQAPAIIKKLSAASNDTCGCRAPDG